MSVREKLQDYLSYPPKGLRADRAAAYLDMSKSKFLALVDGGIIPQPANLGGVKVWDRVVHYINDPTTQEDAVKILAARVGLDPEAYKPLLKGTHLIDLAEGKKVFVKADGLGSLYGSSATANDFNVKNEVYKESQDVDSYIDPSLTNAVAPMAAATP